MNGQVVDRVPLPAWTSIEGRSRPSLEPSLSVAGRTIKSRNRHAACLRPKPDFSPGGPRLVITLKCLKNNEKRGFLEPLGRPALRPPPRSPRHSDSSQPPPQGCLESPPDLPLFPRPPPRKRPGDLESLLGTQNPDSMDHPDPPSWGPGPQRPEGSRPGPRAPGKGLPHRPGAPHHHTPVLRRRWVRRRKWTLHRRKASSE